MSESHSNAYVRAAAAFLLLATVISLKILQDICTRKSTPAVVQYGHISSGSFSVSSLAQPPGSNCSEDWLGSVARQSDESFVYESVLRTKLQQPACTLSRGAVPTVDSVLFVVMCSTDIPRQVTSMVQAWMHWVPPENIILLCGGEIPGLNVTLLPRLAVDDALDAIFKEPTGKTAANLRHLRSIWWLVNEVPWALRSYDWVFYVDDDTFVNMPLLLSFLHGIPTHLPLLFSHIFQHPLPPNWAPPHLAWPSGGSGMLFTKPALQQLGSMLFSPGCEVHEALNDVSIGKCTRLANITKVDCSTFLPDVTRLCRRFHGGRSDVGMVLTVHWVKSQAQIKEFTCLVAARFGWPHPQCPPH